MCGFIFKVYRNRDRRQTGSLIDLTSISAVPVVSLHKSWSLKLVPRDKNAHSGGGLMLLLRLTQSISDDQAIYAKDAACHFVVDSVGDSSEFHRHSDDCVVIPVTYRSAQSPALSFDSASTRYFHFRFDII